MTANDPLTCGFLKIKVFHLLVRDSYKLGNNNTCVAAKSDIYKEHCLEIKDFFHGFESFCFDSKFYNRNLIVVKKLLFDVGKTASNKQQVLEIFSEKCWQKLTIEEKRTHTLKDCNGCLSNDKFKRGFSYFPVNKRCKALYAKAKKHGLIREPKRKSLKETTNTTNNETAINRYVYAYIYIHTFSSDFFFFLYSLAGKPCP